LYNPPRVRWKQDGPRAWLAAPHPPDPTQTELLPRENLAASAEAGCVRHQELGVRATEQRAGARGPELGPPRDRRGWRRRFPGRGPIHRRAERRGSDGNVPIGARRRLPGSRHRGARAGATPTEEG